MTALIGLIVTALLYGILTAAVGPAPCDRRCESCGSEREPLAEYSGRRVCGPCMRRGEVPPE